MDRLKAPKPKSHLPRPVEIVSQKPFYSHPNRAKATSYLPIKSPKPLTPRLYAPAARDMTSRPEPLYWYARKENKMISLKHNMFPAPFDWSWNMSFQKPRISIPEPISPGTAAPGTEVTMDMFDNVYLVRIAEQSRTDKVEKKKLVRDSKVLSSFPSIATAVDEEDTWSIWSEYEESEDEDENEYENEAVDKSSGVLSKLVEMLVFWRW